MKRLIITLTAILSGIGLCKADKIVTRSADIIECTVTEISDNAIKYRKPGEKFEREITRKDIFKIKYDNGEETVIKPSESTVRVQQQSVIQNNQYVNVATTPDWNALPPASRIYHVGDWYSENGVEGIVIYTTPDGLHGRIVHPKQFKSSAYHPKSFFKGPTDVPFGMNDLSNGYANMVALNRFISANPQYTPDMYPIYTEYIKPLGDGWYIPSIKELEYYQNLRDQKTVYTGDIEKFKGKTVKYHKIFDHQAKKHDGDKHYSYYYLSSTEIYSPGGASVTFQSIYGDPATPQFALMKYEHDKPSKAVVRTMGLPILAFHLF
ncbi:MAG: hypothetical protein K2M94_07510 [Paramuribaculum sp.]|nr:hypothetical protein [Paramuribaculum sp.]